jgi:hypothetical protein
VPVDSTLLKQPFGCPTASFKMKLLVSRFLFFFSRLSQSFFPELMVLMGNAFLKAVGP